MQAGFLRAMCSGKAKRVKFGTPIHNTEGILDYIHTGVWGPTKTASLGGKHYFVTFVDDFSRRVWMYTLKSKDEVFETFLVWKKMVENQTGRKIKVLRSDNGTEYQMINFRYSVRRKAYLGTLQLEIHRSRMGWQNA